ncbi:MAG: L,D-transpeptidase family protein [Spirochaetia bacterium]|nr:L,D-transpeptidase family protein [Spirochaetia bacterium]
MEISKPLRTVFVFFFLCPILFSTCIRAERTLNAEKAIAIMTARYRLKAMFEARGLFYPPKEVAFIGLKQEKQLEIRAKVPTGWVKIKSYPILKASGHPGPKLREGDLQVPEGVYKISRLNPESSYYLSLKINFPNEFDLEHAEAENRTEPGSDIFIHGKDVSTGCLAMGDPAIEEIYTLAYDTGHENIAVVIAPNDLRTSAPVTKMESAPTWTGDLYAEIQTQLRNYSKVEKVR